LKSDLRDGGILNLQRVAARGAWLLIDL